jgi:bilirubin oxidase
VSPSPDPIPPPIYVNGPVLDPACVAKYQSTLLLPPIMPRLTGAADPNPDSDEYIISVREIMQSVLPGVKPANAPPECADYDPTKKTRVFAYGSDIDGQATHNWPAFTIEATRNRPVQVRWVNELVDENKRYRPHLLADQLDQTLHWANPGMLGGMTDHSACEGCPDKPNCNIEACTKAATTKYTGPVPIVTHVHGNAGVQDNSDGYTEAWYMPDATNLGAYAKTGTWYDIMKEQAQSIYPTSGFGPGYATFSYATKQRATQLWYHDHTLGVTRLNVYAGLAGFFMLRDFFPNDKPELPGLPFPPPGRGPNEAVRELLLAVQDRAFDTNNQLYYPKQDAVKPEDALPRGPVPPTWKPEFEAKTADGRDATMMMVNGHLSPRHSVIREPYRLRVLNGCNAKALVLYFSTTQPTPGNEIAATGIIPFYIVGNEGGFFPSIVGPLKEVLMGPAERYDIILDFSSLTAGSKVYMLNKGPAGPYDGSNAGDGLTVHLAQVMRFDVQAGAPANGPFDAAKRAALNAALKADYSKAPIALPAATVKRQFALLEEFESDHPVAQYLGTIDDTNADAQKGLEQHWSAQVRFVSGVNATEEWTIVNLTPDAHPIHIHEVLFEVVKYEKVDINEQKEFKFTGELGLPSDLLQGQIIAAPCDAASGSCAVRKDTTLMPPGFATTVRLRTAGRPGLFVWHCHLLEHEDNEMMHPWCVGNPGYTNPHTGRPMCVPAP